jgi:hypothetical protein
MKIFILVFLVVTMSSASASWRQWMECVVVETVNGVETRVDPNPTIDFGVVGHGVLDVPGKLTGLTAKVSGSDNNIKITAHDTSTGTRLVSHSMGVRAVAIMVLEQGGRKLELSCLVRNEN